MFGQWSSVALRRHTELLTDVLLQLSCSTSHSVKESWIHAVRAVQARGDIDASAQPNEWRAMVTALAGACAHHPLSSPLLRPAGHVTVETPVPASPPLWRSLDITPTPPSQKVPRPRLELASGLAPLSTGLTPLLANLRIASPSFSSAKKVAASAGRLLSPLLRSAARSDKAPRHQLADSPTAFRLSSRLADLPMAPSPAAMRTQMMESATLHGSPVRPAPSALTSLAEASEGEAPPKPVGGGPSVALLVGIIAATLAAATALTPHTAPDADAQLELARSPPLPLEVRTFPATFPATLPAGLQAAAPLPNETWPLIVAEEAMAVSAPEIAEIALEHTTSSDDHTLPSAIGNESVSYHSVRPAAERMQAHPQPLFLPTPPQPLFLPAPPSVFSLPAPPHRLLLPAPPREYTLPANRLRLSGDGWWFVPDPPVDDMPVYTASGLAVPTVSDWPASPPEWVLSHPNRSTMAALLRGQFPVSPSWLQCPDLAMPCSRATLSEGNRSAPRPTWRRQANDRLASDDYFSWPFSTIRTTLSDFWLQIGVVAEHPPSRICHEAAPPSALGSSVGMAVAGGRGLPKRSRYHLAAGMPISSRGNASWSLTHAVARPLFLGRVVARPLNLSTVVAVVTAPLELPPRAIQLAALDLPSSIQSSIQSSTQSSTPKRTHNERTHNDSFLRCPAALPALPWAPQPTAGKAAAPATSAATLALCRVGQPSSALVTFDHQVVRMIWPPLASFGATGVAPALVRTGFWSRLSERMNEQLTLENVLPSSAGEMATDSAYNPLTLPAASPHTEDLLVSSPSAAPSTPSLTFLQAPVVDVSSGDDLSRAVLPAQFVDTVVSSLHLPTSRAVTRGTQGGNQSIFQASVRTRQSAHVHAAALQSAAAMFEPFSVPIAPVAMPPSRSEWVAELFARPWSDAIVPAGLLLESVVDGRLDEQLGSRMRRMLILLDAVFCSTSGDIPSAPMAWNRRAWRLTLIGTVACLLLGLVGALLAKVDIATARAPNSNTVDGAMAGGLPAAYLNSGEDDAEQVHRPRSPQPLASPTGTTPTPV